ncbi:hypothetical protein XENTR_v10014934 [Xenopus tropicalis]|nr:hypothetical protein XENTR_v10014934 [Xenopus tropicalis]
MQKCLSYGKAISHRLHYNHKILIFINDFLFICTSIGPFIRKPIIQKILNYRWAISHRLHFNQIIHIFKNGFLFLCNNKTVPVLDPN